MLRAIAIPYTGGHRGWTFEASRNEASSSTPAAAPMPTSPLYDVNDQKDNNEKIDHETNGENVVPS